jgi:hypothetical protein
MDPKQRECPVTRRAFHLLHAALIVTASAFAPVAFAQAPVEGGDRGALEGFSLRGTQSAPEVTGAVGTGRAGQTRGEIRPPLDQPVALPVREPVGLPPVAPMPLGVLEFEPAAEEESPYSPLGLRVGSLTLFSTVTQSAGYDTNPQRLANAGRGDAFSRTEGEFRLESDWSRHLMTARLRGSYDAFGRDRRQNRPMLDATAQLHLDITRGTRFTVESGLDLASENAGSPELPQAVVGRPIVTDYYGSANITQFINRTQFRLRGLVGRTEYRDVRLRDGSILSRRDRDLTRLETTLRTSYDVHPGLLPFFELAFDRRNYDRRVGPDGLRRSSRGLTGRVGTTFELTRTLVGEASLGYQTRRYDDSSLRPLDGIIGDAALEWSLSPITTVTVSGASRIGETTVPGASGTRMQRVGLEIRHDLRRHLTINGGVAFERTIYGGTGGRARSFIGSAGLAYSFNRALALTVDFRHERTWSTRRDDAYAANTYLVGLRFQH